MPTAVRADPFGVPHCQGGAQIAVCASIGQVAYDATPSTTPLPSPWLVVSSPIRLALTPKARPI
ncbi:MAG: hypothetical protein ACK5O5_00555 [bacterium]